MKTYAITWKENGITYDNDFSDYDLAKEFYDYMVQFKDITDITFEDEEGELL